jgi:hypothetical protein
VEAAGLGNNGDWFGLEMALLDETFRRISQTLLSKFGGTATLVDPRHEYDPLTGSEVKLNDVEYTIRITPPERWKIEQGKIAERSEASNVLTSALQVYTDAKSLAIEPTVGLHVHWGRRVFRVVAVEPINGGDETILWKLGLSA